MTNNAKAWYQSKTVLANLVTAVCAALLLVSEQSWVSERGVEVLFLASGLLNLGLRCITEQPITVPSLKKSRG